MKFKEFLTVFGGLGLFLGSLSAVQLFVVSGGRVIPSLLMLLGGLAIGFTGGLLRVIQLRHSAAARASLAAQPQPSLSSVFSPGNLILLLLGVPPMLAVGLRAPALVQVAVVIPLVVAVALQMSRKGHR